MSLVFYSLRGFLKTHTHTHTNKRTYRFITFWWARLDFKNHQFVCIFGVEPNEGQHRKLETPLLPGNSNFMCATKATYPSAMMHFKNCYLQDASLGKFKIEKKKADVMLPMTDTWDWYIHLHEWLIFYGECWYTYHTWIPYDPLGFARKGTRIDNVEWT